jgi:hypothetical protein
MEVQPGTQDIQQQIYAHKLMAGIRYRDRDLDGLRRVVCKQCGVSNMSRLRDEYQQL